MSRITFIRSTMIAALCIALLVSVQLPCGASTKASKEKPTFHLKSVQDPIRALGISGLECKCTYTIRADSGAGEKFWLFQSEPRITGINPDGPAAGILQKGDVIVGIDGLLITTRKAGERFANIKPQETVELAIRRSGRTLEKTITAGASDRTGGLEVEGADTSLTVKMDQLYQSIETLARHASDLSMVLDIPELPHLAELKGLSFHADIPELKEFSVLRDRTFLPSGWFGFSLSFSGSITSKKGEDRSRWDFDSPPKIREVAEDSPADHAGLRAGDYLTHIDGIKIDSKRGGKLFSAVQPGQTVTWTVRRDDAALDIEMTAEERPQSPEVHGINIKPEGFPGDSSSEKRFRTTVGRAEIEVEGDDSIRVIEDTEKGEIIITARGIKVRIRETNKE